MDTVLQRYASHGTNGGLKVRGIHGSSVHSRTSFESWSQHAMLPREVSSANTQLGKRLLPEREVLAPVRAAAALGVERPCQALFRTVWRHARTEVEDAVAPLQDIRRGLQSEVDRFAVEFEDKIVSANLYCCELRFRRLLRIRRFEIGLRIDRLAPVSVRRPITDACEPAESNKWDTSVPAFRHDRPARRADDIPTRGAATFRADTVAVADGSSGSSAAEAP